MRGEGGRERDLVHEKDGVACAAEFFFLFFFFLGSQLHVFTRKCTLLGYATLGLGLPSIKMLIYHQNLILTRYYILK